MKVPNNILADKAIRFGINSSSRVYYVTYIVDANKQLKIFDKGEGWYVRGSKEEQKLELVFTVVVFNKAKYMSTWKWLEANISAEQKQLINEIRG